MATLSDSAWELLTHRKPLVQLPEVLAQATGMERILLGRVVSSDYLAFADTFGTSPTTASLSKGVLARAYSGEPVFLGHSEIAALPNDSFLAGMAPINSFFAIGIASSDGVPLGALVGASSETRAFGSDWRGLLSALAVRIGLELELERQTMLLSATASAERLFERASSTEDAYQAVLQAVLSHTSATRAEILLLHGDYLEWVAAKGFQAQELVGTLVPRGTGVGWRVIDSHKPIYLPHANRDPEFLFYGEETDSSYLAIPLLNSEKRIIGVLAADTAGVGGQLSSADQYYLESLALAAGATLSRLRALEAARAAEQRAKKVARFASYLENLSEPEEIFTHSLGTLLELTGFQAAGYYQRIPGTLDNYQFRALNGEIPAPMRQVLEGLVMRPSAELGPLGRSLARKTPIFIPNYQEDSAALPGVREVLSSLAAVPVFDRAEVVGWLTLYSFDQERREDPLPLAIFAAERLGHALERSGHIEALRTARRESLRALGVALEYRDFETKGHTDRVYRLAYQLGRKLGLAEEELKQLGFGAYLHDVGKVAIPDRVLLKPGKLDPEEWRLMQQHTLIGEEMVQRMGFLTLPVLQVVRNHHEQFSGHGYPDQLTGEAIPLLARIFTLADVYDALTSDRPYKTAWTPEQAGLEIERSLGRQFDPEIGRIFLEIIAVERLLN